MGTTACSASTRRGTTPHELSVYKSAHYSALPAAIQGTASNEDLLERFPRGGLLLLGDIHDDRELHVIQAQILQKLIHHRKEIVLHVEFLGLEDAEALDLFLSGQIDLEELRLRVQERWPGSWMEFQGFDWRFYRRLLQTAREHAIDVRPLEQIPRLELRLRDQGMATEITEAMQDRPEALHIVLVGHTHLLGAGHLASFLGHQQKIILLPRGSSSLTNRLGVFASNHSAAWHAPYLVLDEELWLLNPLPLRPLGLD